MKALYDLSCESIVLREYDVASNTALASGQVVYLSSGKVVKAGTSQTAAILGVAAEPHSGTADLFNARANGTSILVAGSPTLIYACAAPTITATGGSTTTVVATGLSVMDDDDLAGAVLVLTAKGAGSANTDPIGTHYTCSAYAKATKTLTISTAGGAVTSGDVFTVYLPFGNAYAQLTTDASALTICGGTTVALPFKVIGHDFNRQELHLFAKSHEFAHKSPNA